MAYNEDEENPPVGFEQDPTHDETGIGDWLYPDGSRRYGAGDPELAKTLLAKGAGLAGAQPPPTTPAPPSADQQFLNSTTGAEQDEQNPEPAPETPAPATPAPSPVLPQAPALAPMPAAGRVPLKSVKDTTSEHAEQNAQSSQSTNRTGSAQDRGEFERQQGDIAKGYEAQKGAADTGAASIVGALQQRQQLLAQMGADQEAKTAAAQASAEARGKIVTQKIQEVSARPIDNDQIWKDKGALGTAFGLLGVALASIESTKFGGPNVALEEIRKQREDAIRSQVEDRNSHLRGLERELGSIEAAKPMLEARMNDALSKRIDSMTVNEKSQTILANAQQVKAQLDTESASKKAEAAKAYYGTLATQQSMQAGQTQSQGAEQSVDRERPAGSGAKPMTPKELAETDKMWEEQGKTPEERAILWQKSGYAPPTGKTAAELKREGKDGEGDKRTDDQGKASGALDASENYANALGLVRDKHGQWVPGGKPGTEAEQKAAKTALKVGLHLEGYDEKSVESATPEAGDWKDKLVGGAGWWPGLPLLYHFANATTPEDQAAQLNAAEAATRPRLNPADRAASTSTERGAGKGKKVGNMAQAR